MILFLLKSSIVIIVLLAFYKLVLEKESFFKANRLYLLTCLIIAAVLPFVSLPELVTNQGFVSGLLTDIPIVKGEKSEYSASPELLKGNDKAKTGEHLPKGYTKSEEKINSGDITEKTTDEFKVEPENELWTEDKSAIAGPSSISKKSGGKSIFYWLQLLYLFGVAVLLLNLLAQIISTLWKAWRSKDKVGDEEGILVNMTGNVEPCSFFKYIFINPASYDFDTYEQIVAHEKIHVRLWHTIDLLLSEIAVIALWFNPFVWLLRKEVEKNIEYQTDDILVNGEAEVKEIYQLNLVKIASYTKPLAITTNYNQSLIKQRIIKMNIKRSNQYSYWKYTFVLPILFILLLVINKPQSAIAQASMEENIQELPLDNKFSNRDSDSINSENDKPTTQEELAHRTTTTTVLKSIPDIDDDIPSSPIVIDSECKKLLSAIEKDDLQAVVELIKKTDVNCIEYNPGYNEVKTGRNIWRIEKAKSPLTAAARTGNIEIGKILIENGADINLNADGDGTAIIASSEYGHKDFLEMLIAKGGKIGVSDSNNGNALIAASRNGHTDIVALLLSKNMDVNAYFPNQGTAFISAALNGHMETLKRLKSKGATTDFLAPNQGTALIGAANNGHLETVKYLLGLGHDINRIAPNQGNPLIAAANNGHTETVEYLINKGADVNLIAPNQGNALIAAANNGHLLTIKLLLEKGADIDMVSPNQGNALVAAANNGHETIAEYLLKQGASVNVNTPNQGSALISAARNGRNDLIELLLGKGMDINQHSDGQGFALNAAAANGHISTINLLLSKGANINLQNNGSGSALNAAARNGLNNVIELLLSKGAHIDLQNNGQGSALNAASRNGHNTTIELLLSKGANINLQNNGQGSPLNAAARNGLLSTVKLLIDKGANVNQYSDGQRTALSAASKNGHKDVVDYLLSKGAEHIYGN